MPRSSPLRTGDAQANHQTLPLPPKSFKIPQKYSIKSNHIEHPIVEGDSPLYKGQTKAESTAAFLLWTEVLGLNVWLASIYIPNTTPYCTCRWPIQLVRHILLFYNHRTERDQLFAKVGISNITQILSISKGLYTAIKWLIGFSSFRQHIKSNRRI